MPLEWKAPIPRIERRHTAVALLRGRQAENNDLREQACRGRADYLGPAYQVRL
jgi:hypothetical protein